MHLHLTIVFMQFYKIKAIECDIAAKNTHIVYTMLLKKTWVFLPQVAKINVLSAHGQPWLIFSNFFSAKWRFFLIKLFRSWCKILAHQHADVHGQVDFPSAAVVGDRSQTRYNSLSFTDVTRSVVCVDIPNTCNRKRTQGKLNLLSFYLFSNQKEQSLNVS